MIFLSKLSIINNWNYFRGCANVCLWRQSWKVFTWHENRIKCILYDKLFGSCRKGSTLKTSQTYNRNIQVLNDEFTIKEALMTTVHSFTASQTLVDGSSKKVNICVCKSLFLNFTLTELERWSWWCFQYYSSLDWCRKSMWKSNSRIGGENSS